MFEPCGLCYIETCSRLGVVVLQSRQCTSPGGNIAK